jgi:hypothetical protein
VLGLQLKGVLRLRPRTRYWMASWDLKRSVSEDPCSRLRPDPSQEAILGPKEVNIRGPSTTDSAQTHYRNTNTGTLRDQYQRALYHRLRPDPLQEAILGPKEANIRGPSCSRSLWRAATEDKRMVLVHTHGLFIT